MLSHRGSGPKWLLVLPRIHGGPFTGTDDLTAAWTQRHEREFPLGVGGRLALCCKRSCELQVIPQLVILSVCSVMADVCHQNLESYRANASSRIHNHAFAVELSGPVLRTSFAASCSTWKCCLRLVARKKTKQFLSR